MRPFIVSFVMVVISVATATSGVAGMHPFHSTMAEVEWNPESSAFEVSLQLSGVEIEDELSQLHGRRINLETTDGAESLLEDYVRKHFQITDATRSSCAIRWVGIEVQIRYVWAYFEVRLTDRAPANDGSQAGGGDADSSADTNAAVVAVPDQKTSGEPDDASEQTSFQDLKVRSTLMTESRPNQVNYVAVATPDQTGSAHLTRNQPEARVEFVDRPKRWNQQASEVHHEDH